MPTFAAIDIGSNSCRLKIATVQMHRLKTLHEDREVTRLGESVFQTGVISPEAMAATIRALKRFHKAVQLHVVDKVRVVATSAMRDARNAEAFTEWVKSTTGWNVEVISGLEEGRLIHLGVVTHEVGARGRCLLIDLGGGSCEVTLSDGGRIKAMVSMPLGAVRLQQEFLQTDPPAKEDVARLKQFIDRELRKAERKLGTPRVGLVIATSGTAAALAEASGHVRKGRAAKKALAKKRVERVGELTADTADVRRLADRLVKMNNAQRAAVPGIGPRRSEIIVGGALVYASLLERMGLKGFRYSPLGLRDGMLAQMLAEVDLRASVHQKMESERWAGVLEVCRRYGIEQRKAEPVRQHVVQLFDQLARVHELPEEYKLWLEAAAMMQDVGKFMNHQGHLPAYAVHHCELGDLWVFAGAAGDCECDGAVPGQDAAGSDGSGDADDSAGGAYACDAGGGAAAAGGGVESGPGERGGADADAGVSEARAAGAGSGARWGGAGGVVAEERGGLLPRGLSAGALCRGGVEGADGAGVEQPLQGGGAAGEDEAGEGAFAEADLAAGVGSDAGTRSEPRKLVRLGLWPTTSRFSWPRHSWRSFWKSLRVASGARRVGDAGSGLRSRSRCRRGRRSGGCA